MAQEISLFVYQNTKSPLKHTGLMWYFPDDDTVTRSDWGPSEHAKLKNPWRRQKKVDQVKVTEDENTQVLESGVWVPKHYKVKLAARFEVHKQEWTGFMASIKGQYHPLTLNCRDHCLFALGRIREKYGVEVEIDALTWLKNIKKNDIAVGIGYGAGGVSLVALISWIAIKMLKE